MSILLICNHQKNYFILATKIVLKKICLVYFPFIIFKKQDIKSNWHVIQFNFFSIFFFVCVIENIKKENLIFVYYFWNKFKFIICFLQFNTTVRAYWKHLLVIFEYIVSTLFFIQSGESIYDLTWFRILKWHL